jgi:3-(3-hydroxy-phenyl)propionate hydroxylase
MKLPEGVRLHHIAAGSINSAMRERYLGKKNQAYYLIRPDQHVAARWTRIGAGALASAHRASLGKA